MISPTTIRLTLLALGLTFVAGSAAIQAQDDATSQSCVTLRSIARTRAVSNDTLLFFMRGKDGKIFRNVLEQACPGLERNRGITYGTTSTRMGRLCRGDQILVEETSMVCSLGEFRPISGEEAEILGRRRR